MPIRVGSSQDKRVRRRVSSRLALLSLAGVVLVALLTLRSDGAHGLDGRLLLDLYSHDVGTTHSLSELLRHLGELLPQLVLVAGAVAIGLYRRLVARPAAAAILVVGADLTTQLLKHLISDGRYGPLARSYGVDEHSFPSGHATTMTALTFAYLLVVPARLRLPVAIVGGILTVLVAGSMVVLHRHWPSDAVGGVLVGCVWGFGTIAALESWPSSGGQAAPPSRR